MPNTIYGYETRDPFMNELLYFMQNPTVSGMATEDNKIILNPFIELSEEEKQSVLKNEAVRLYMRENNIIPDFDLTKEQRQFFMGTPYEKDEIASKQTMVGRIISGDPSSGKITLEQKKWSNAIMKNLENRNNNPQKNMVQEWLTP